MARPVPHDEDGEPPSSSSGTHRGNWGNKMQPGARWKRQGKSSSWGAGRAEWEVRVQYQAFSEPKLMVFLVD